MVEQTEFLKIVREHGGGHIDQNKMHYIEWIAVLHENIFPIQVKK